jgi:DUF1680 family protein
MPTLKQYIWSLSDDGVNVNLFISSTARLTTDAGEVVMKQETEYPWSGDIKISVDPDNEGSFFILRIRIPEWTGNAPFDGGLYRYITRPGQRVRISVNGKRTKMNIVDGFALIEREWNRGDVVDVSLPMEPRFIEARDEVEADRGRVALGVGPVVYCLEEADNGPVRELTVDPEVKVEFQFDPVLLGGVGTLDFTAKAPSGTLQKVKAVPYYSWANRGRGEMTVWIKTDK